MQVIKEHFVFRSPRGQDVMGFDSHTQATDWRDLRQKSRGEQSSALVLVRVTRTEEVLQ